MLAFVDESGDGGRLIEAGSSPFFVVSVVTFNDRDEALACDQRIDALRAELKHAPGSEFHFTKNSLRVRHAFLEAVCEYPFFFHVFALNKDPKLLTGPGFQFKDSLYKFAARLTFENAKPYLQNATVVIDKSGNRKFRQELSSYLRKRINDQSGTKTITYYNSQTTLRARQVER